MILGVTGLYPAEVERDLSLMNVLHNMAAKTIQAMSPEVVLTTMTKGFPQAAASACISLGIPFVVYLGYENQDAIWTEGEKAIYDYLMQKATKLIYTDECRFWAWKKVKAARAVVDGCDHLFTLFDGDKTERLRLAVDYANDLRRRVENCWPTWVRFLARRREMAAARAKTLGQVNELDARLNLGRGRCSRYEDVMDERDWEGIV